MANDDEPSDEDFRPGILEFRRPQSVEDKALAHRQALEVAFRPLVAAMEAARHDGFLVEFQVPLNGFGQYALTGLSIVKRW